jgi:hypothetical protein
MLPAFAAADIPKLEQNDNAGDEADARKRHQEFSARCSREHFAHSQLELVNLLNHYFKLVQQSFRCELSGW